MPWYGTPNTWKNIGKDAAKVVGGGGGNSKGSKELWEAVKKPVNEVWYTGKGVLTTAEGLVGNVGNTLGLLGNPMFLMLIFGGIILSTLRR